MNDLLEFLHAAKTFFLATVEDGEPRVRPFGLAVSSGGRVYFCTGTEKPCCRQMKAHSGVELCATHPDGRWLRMRGRAVFDDNAEVKRACFAAAPSLASIYGTPEDPSFAVFYLDAPEATLYAFGPKGIETTPLPLK